MSVRHGYADLGGVRLHYATAGAGDELIVLLHGFPEYWHSWRHQIPELANTHTVVAPDLRGYNLSDKPHGVSHYKIDLLTADVAGLIRYLGHQRAIVVGHDWGAAIAWRLAMTNPQLVLRLIVLQVPPMHVWRRNITFKQLIASWYMFFFQLPWLPEWLARRNDFAMLKNALRQTTSKKGIFGEDDIAAYAAAWRHPGALTAMINYYRANLRTGLVAKHAAPRKVTAPTLFIYGEKDHAILRPTVRGVRDAVEGPYREHRIPESAHWVQQEAAEEVTRVMREFIDEPFLS